MDKSVQLDYHADGGVTVTYFLGEKEVGSKKFERVPKRLTFFLEKFPRDAKEVENSK
jgi:hypothetical protein